MDMRDRCCLCGDVVDAAVSVLNGARICVACEGAHTQLSNRRGFDRLAMFLVQEAEAQCRAAVQAARQEAAEQEPVVAVLQAKERALQLWLKEK